MCHITYIPEQKNVLNEWKIQEFLEETFEYNSDGCGVSFFNKNNGKPVLIKSKNSMTNLIKLAKKYQTTNGWLFHTRITSRGSSMLLNNHPFFLGEEANAFIAHNGTLRNAPYHAYKSDTNILASHLRKYHTSASIDILLDELFKIEGYSGSTIVIQYPYLVKVFNYYRFSEVDFIKTDNGDFKIFTSTGYFSSDKKEKKIKKGQYILYPYENSNIKYDAFGYSGNYGHYGYNKDIKTYSSFDEYCGYNYNKNNNVTSTEQQKDFNSNYGINSNNISSTTTIKGEEIKNEGKEEEINEFVTAVTRPNLYGSDFCS